MGNLLEQKKRAAYLDRAPRIIRPHI